MEWLEYIIETRRGRQREKFQKIVRRWVVLSVVVNIVRMPLVRAAFFVLNSVCVLRELGNGGRYICRQPNKWFCAASRMINAQALDDDGSDLFFKKKRRSISSYIHRIFTDVSTWTFKHFKFAFSESVFDFFFFNFRFYWMRNRVRIRTDFQDVAYQFLSTHNGKVLNFISFFV